VCGVEPRQQHGTDPSEEVTMSRVGWATVIGCVFGVMLFGILQRGCDAEGTSGVQILPMQGEVADANASAPAKSAPGLSVAPGFAPERAISGPTSPSRGTPQRLQVGARNNAAARAGNSGATIVDEDSNAAQLDWLRENRERALENRRRAQEIARQTADQLRGKRPTTSVGSAAVAPRPLAQNEFATQPFVEETFFEAQGFEGVALASAVPSFGRSELAVDETIDSAFEGVSASDSTGGSMGSSGGGSTTVTGNGGTTTNNGADSGSGTDTDDGTDGGTDSGGATTVQPPVLPTLSAPADAATGALPTLTFSWGSATRAASYTLQVATVADFSTTVYSQTGITTTSQAVPAGRLAAGTSYFWRVLAVNTGGQTASATRTFSTLAAPGAFSVTSPTNNAVGVRTPLTLSWSASTGATAYSVIVASDQAFSQVVATGVGLTETSFVVPDGAVENGREYWWRVIASNPAGSALVQPTLAKFTTLGAPGAFTLASPANSGTQVLIPTPLTWTPSQFASSYKVEVATDANFNNRVVNRAGVLTPVLVLTSSEIQPGTTYWWRVTAENELDITGSSQVFSFTTAPLPGAFSLTTPANNANVGAPVTLRWSESERALLYVVQVSTDEAFANLVVDEFVIPLLTGETAFSIPDGVLQTGQTYFWRIEAQNEVGVRNAATPVFRFTIRTTDFDLTGDGRVDVRDLYAYHAASPTPDVNLDGQANNDDRLALRNRVRATEKTEISSGRAN
jgi:hypothetical protein